MKEMIQKIRKYFADRIMQIEEDFQYYYAIVESTKYHEIIDEYSNTYSIYKIKQSKMMGDIYELVEDGIISFDIAESLVNIYMNRDIKYKSEGKKLVKEYKFKSAEQHV